ncbi:MAG: FecR domain-containing protein [Pseudomonadota bacterium]
MSALKPHSRDLIRDAAYEWYLIISSGQATADDIRNHQKWLAENPLHEDAYDRVVTVWAALGTIEKSDLWPGAVKLKGDRPVIGLLSPLTKWRSIVLGAAAVASAFLIGIIALNSFDGAASRDFAPETLNQQIFETGVGETRAITLDDGTVLTLGARTKVSLAFSDRARLILMETGAAIFDVTKDPSRAFRVKTGAISATALGTEFEVRNNGDLVRVLVNEGQVEVSEPFWVDGNKTSLENKNLLSAGLHISALPGERMSAPSATNAALFGAWREGRLEYVGATLSELIADANRYSTTPIKIEADLADIETTRITAFFDSDDIDAMLSTLPDLFEVTIERNDDEISIRPAP